MLWGTQSRSQLADVLVNDAQTNPTNDGAFGAAEVGEGVFFTQSEVTDPRGTAEARAGLQFGNNQVPVLRGRSTLTGDTTPGGPNGAVARTDAFASEIFQYTGLVPRSDLQITFTLTGSVVDLPADPQTFIVAKAGIFEEADYFFDPFLSNLVFGPPPLPVAKALDDTTLQILDDTGGTASTVGTTLTFAATPGELFYVHMSLSTSAFRDMRSADAFSTLSAEFEEPDLYVPLSVPEPRIGLLVACAVAALRRPSRRHRRA